MVNLKSALCLGTFLSLVAAHPGHDIEAEILERRNYFESLLPEHRSLAHCQNKFKAAGTEQRAVARREALVRQKRDLSALAKRQEAGADFDEAHYEQVLNSSHLVNDSSISLGSTEVSLFTNASVTLVPETILGPYWISGEFMRKNVTETQPGVPMTLDIQIIDINTCEPVPNVYIDIWHCNSTGVYSGVQQEGNGEYSDASNLDKTFLRGVAPTDLDGVAAFETIFPGHYAQRATHLHILTHTDITIFANGTYYANASYSGGRVQHSGQLFFDQDLVDDINTNVAPYNTNTITVVPNNVDQVLTNETQYGADPVANYVFLGDKLSDGILAWTAIGVNMTVNYNATPNAEYEKDGGRMVNTDLHQGIDFLTTIP